MELEIIDLVLIVGGAFLFGLVLGSNLGRTVSINVDHTVSRDSFNLDE